MDAQTLANLQSSIQTMNVCSDLQAYKSQVLALMNAEQAIIAQKVVDLTSLTNPATFIANSIIIAIRELATVTTLASNLTADVATVTALLEAQAAKLPNCVLV